MNILDAPCRACGRETKTLWARFGDESPLVVLNAVPDRAGGDWLINSRSVEHHNEDEARKLRASGFDLFTEHVCAGGGA